MSELNTPRLMAAAKEFNIGKDTLVDFLVSKGFNNDDLKPTAKLTEPMYRVLQSEFQQDKAAKEKAEKVELIKTGGSSEPKKKKDEQDLSIKKKETVVVVPTPVEEPKVEEEKPKPLVIEKAEVNEEKKVEEKKEKSKAKEQRAEVTNIEAPKVLATIDLDAIDSSTRPKKAAKKEEPKDKAKVEEPKKTVKKAESKKEEVKVEEKIKKQEPKIEESEKVDLPPVIENIQADKLLGPRILGKITLPVDNDTRPKKDNEDRHKRKRIPIAKKPGQAPGQQGAGGQQPSTGTGGGYQGGQNRTAGSGGGYQGGQNRTAGTGGGYQGGQNRGAATGGGNRFNKTGSNTGAARQDKVIDAKEIQDKLKETQAKLAGSTWWAAGTW